MKKINLFSLAFLLSLTLRVEAKGTDLEVKKLPLPDAVSLIWGDVFNAPYMLAPELTDDVRLLSLKLTPGLDERAFVLRYLANMNVKVSKKNGVDYIYAVVPDLPKEHLISFTYAPKYRSVDYLYNSLSQFFANPTQTSAVQHTAQGGQVYVPVATNTRYLSPNGDTLLFRGSSSEVAQIKTLLADLDVRAEQIEVMAYVFEVQTQDKNGSGMALAANLLSGRFKLGLGSAASYSNFLQFSGGSIDVLYELFSQDSRFHVVSSPHLRVSSGNEGRFSVGSDVPVLSSVTYKDNTPVQSVEYRSSGVIFTVKPLINQHVISLDVNQQLSNFAKTETGVNNSPTLIKREIATNVNLQDGDIIILGGLAENKDSEANTGFSFLPDVFKSKSDEKTKTDIMIALQVKKVKSNSQTQALTMKPMP
ncbi:TPA: type II secretion system protein GspD [Providencia rettgeri]|nr:type II secretion system protein GspD [Providencia rettgeri]HEM8269037.1 type II secretion system protein GspD [Providencia rettgeri]